MLISIIIPVYNEEERIVNTLKKINKFLKNKKIKNEIIIVDDGSTDNTRNVIKSTKTKFTLTKKRDNRGKGYSVKEGMLLAKGDLILFSDADLSTPIQEIEKFLKYINKSDIVIGSRALKESNVQTKWIKKVMGRISNLIISLIIIKDIKDTQCGFKLFRRKAAKDLFKRQRINGFGFDFEILYLAKKFNYSIKELPVKWIINTNSKVKLIDYPKTFIDLIKIKINNIKGIYN